MRGTVVSYAFYEQKLLDMHCSPVIKAVRAGLKALLEPRAVLRKSPWPLLR